MGRGEGEGSERELTSAALRAIERLARLPMDGTDERRRESRRHLRDRQLERRAFPRSSLDVVDVEDEVGRYPCCGLVLDQPQAMDMDIVPSYRREIGGDPLQL